MASEPPHLAEHRRKTNHVVDGSPALETALATKWSIQFIIEDFHNSANVEQQKSVNFNQLKGVLFLLVYYFFYYLTTITVIVSIGPKSCWRGLLQ